MVLSPMDILISVFITTIIGVGNIKTAAEQAEKNRQENAEQVRLNRTIEYVSTVPLKLAETSHLLKSAREKILVDRGFPYFKGRYRLKG
ncbi:hypothetical protein MO867_21025 [Microbulbifer sp. OS29]|uniref:Uncharacterized protein n=1 Tax=Microbulbifer okhotskensis TaxID=2926617 RepID=A0A9X2EQX8_9GAMM|nr:hypothetical protein [Microbulbifer okhotskensis]MCO1336814.1 hypothetical protein [Microbulbifer okhotskensis]